MRYLSYNDVSEVYSLTIAISELSANVNSFNNDISLNSTLLIHQHF